MDEWKNLADEIFKELNGEEEFNRLLAIDKQPPPTPTWKSAFKLRRDTSLLKMGFALKTLKERKKATHPNGLAAVGTIRIVDHPQFPEHEFFVPGRTFLGRLRHASLTVPDQTMTDLFSAAIKFADSDWKSPMDLVMMTGYPSPLFDTAATFAAMDAVRGGNEATKKYQLSRPEYLWTNIEALRRTPDSFTDLRYDTKFCMEFKAKDGVKRYCKFRLMPADRRTESGRLSAEQQRQAWVNDRHPEETRSPTYLSEELQERLKKGSVEYLLQIQIHEAREDDTWEVFHAGRSSAWDNDPFLDLAHVTMTALLPMEISDKTSFNVGNLPPSISIIPAVSADDSRCLLPIRKEIYNYTRKLRAMVGKYADDELCRYIVGIETGFHKDAATDATISIVITGTIGETDAIVLDKSFYNDMERMRADDYVVKGIDVGEILCVKLINDRSNNWYKDADWMVNKVTITHAQREKSYEFPCHRWVINELVLFTGNAILPQQEQDEIIQGLRRIELQKRQEEYQWGSGLPDFPGYVQASDHDSLPRDSQLPTESLKALKTMNKGSFLLHDKVDKFAAFVDLYENKLEIPIFVEEDQWRDDNVFGKQVLNGVNPMMIQQCQGLPENFPVTESQVEKLLDRGLSLEQEIQSGHVYLMDFKMLQGLPRLHAGTSSERYAADPLVLLYVNYSGDLVPIAIQLFQEPSDTNPIWTPNDDPLDWLFAKMWAQNANLQCHQLVSRLLCTHFIMEPVAVATWRHLPSIHPLHKLLFPHIRRILAVNTLARTMLIGGDGLYDDTLSIDSSGRLAMMMEFYKNHFTWGMLDVPKELNRRGVDDKIMLPGFLYRDDALLLWDVIKNFIMEFVSLYYQKDETVKQDGELQAWMADLAENGYQNCEGHVDHEFPVTCTSREQLVQLLTCVIFTCSGQHAAVNSGMFKMLSFCPNTPPSMRQPPPTKRGATDMKTILNAIPGKRVASSHMNMMRAFSEVALDENRLGDYTDSLFSHDEVSQVMENFHNNLDDIAKTIQQRNDKLQWPYYDLSPENVPRTIRTM